MGRNNIAFIIIGAIALASGIALKLYVGRKRFYRRNQAGLQGFKNYGNAVIIPVIESILLYIGWLLILVGILSIGAAILIGKS